MAVETRIDIHEQPIVNLATEEVVAAERLGGPDLSDQLLMLRGLPRKRVTSVNVRPEGCVSPRVHNQLMQAANSYALAVELTESSQFIGDLPNAAQAVSDLVASGAMVWLDDVGKFGGSNSWFKTRAIHGHVPITGIKVELPTEAKVWDEIQAAASRGLRVIIERIETAEQLVLVKKALQERGLPIETIWGQGYLWSKPVAIMPGQQFRARSRIS